MQITKELAECVGLWLAEGDNKTNREVTFTNNSIDLILFFHRIVKSIYAGVNPSRIYVYSPSERKLYDSIGDIKVNYYHDRRANRPYYIYRLSDAKFTRQWHEIVNTVSQDSLNYAEVLRGFFAGEGNIKYDIPSSSRQIRIAQSPRNELLEKMLNYFEIKFRYDTKHRSYWISSSQLGKADEIHITELHPEKKRNSEK